MAMFTESSSAGGAAVEDDASSAMANSQAVRRSGFALDFVVAHRPMW